MEFQTYSTFLSLSTTQNHPGIIKLMSEAIFKATDSIDDIFFQVYNLGEICLNNWALLILQW